jgi:hypothetical protein
MVKRAAFTKTVTEKYIYQDHLWNVRFGELRRRKGNPGLAERLFRIDRGVPNLRRPPASVNSRRSEPR